MKTWAQIEQLIVEYDAAALYAAQQKEVELAKWGNYFAQPVQTQECNRQVNAAVAQALRDVLKR